MKYAPVALIAVSLGLATHAAHADDVACKPAAGGQGLSIENAIQKAEALGYAVKKAKRSKGCWEVEGFDRNGAEIEIRLDPTSGEVVKPARAGTNKSSD
jgi:hypothetical protein